MKKQLPLVMFIGVLSYCTPKHITSNPDDHAATSGTLGSAKMTNNLPPKQDTARQKKDSLP